MERPPYNPYNYILWDFPSSSLDIKYKKSTRGDEVQQWQILFLQPSMLTGAPTFENSYRVGQEKDEKGE